MSQRGYSYVPTEGYAAFRDDLDQAPWSKIADPASSPQPWSSLSSLPWLTGQKMLLVWTLAELTEALSGEDRPVEGADAQWDAAQRRLHFALAEREASDDPNTAATAKRLRVALLEGRTLAHTRLPYDQEVAIGLRQGQVAQQPEVQRDLQALGLQGHLDAAATTTANLQAALKKTSGATTRTRSVQGALQACCNAFNSVHDQMEQTHERLPPGDPQAVLLAECLATMQALLDRSRPTPSRPPRNPNE